MSYDDALIEQQYWYPKLVCYDSETDIVHRWTRKAGEKLKITHSAEMMPVESEHWCLWIWNFLQDGLEGYEWTGVTH